VLTTGNGFTGIKAAPGAAPAPTATTAKAAPTTAAKAATTTAAPAPAEPAC
jgi:hypothetical protein